MSVESEVVVTALMTMQPQVKEARSFETEISKGEVRHCLYQWWIGMVFQALSFQKLYPSLYVLLKGIPLQNSRGKPHCIQPVISILAGCWGRRQGMPRWSQVQQSHRVGTRLSTAFRQLLCFFFFSLFVLCLLQGSYMLILESLFWQASKLIHFSENLQVQLKHSPFISLM